MTLVFPPLQPGNSSPGKRHVLPRKQGSNVTMDGDAIMLDRDQVENLGHDMLVKRYFDLQALLETRDAHLKSMCSLYENALRENSMLSSRVTCMCQCVTNRHTGPSARAPCIRMDSRTTPLNNQPMAPEDATCSGEEKEAEVVLSMRNSGVTEAPQPEFVITSEVLEELDVLIRNSKSKLRKDAIKNAGSNSLGISDSATLSGGESLAEPDINSSQMMQQQAVFEQDFRSQAGSSARESMIVNASHEQNEDVSDITADSLEDPVHTSTPGKHRCLDDTSHSLKKGQCGRATIDENEGSPCANPTHSVQTGQTHETSVSHDPVENALEEVSTKSIKNPRNIRASFMTPVNSRTPVKTIKRAKPVLPKLVELQPAVDKSRCMQTPSVMPYGSGGDYDDVVCSCSDRSLDLSSGDVNRLVTIQGDTTHPRSSKCPHYEEVIEDPDTNIWDGVNMEEALKTNATFIITECNSLKQRRRGDKVVNKQELLLMSEGKCINVAQSWDETGCLNRQRAGSSRDSKTNGGLSQHHIGYGVVELEINESKASLNLHVARERRKSRIKPRKQNLPKLKPKLPQSFRS